MILIVGSAGFIGSHLMNFYLNKGMEVVGCQTNPLLEGENCLYVDKFNPDFDLIFKRNKFDICINASGSKGVGYSIENPSLDFQLNVENTERLLEAIRNYSPKCKFINLSSAAVYGNPQKLPIKVSDKTNPISPYGKHKLMAENQVAKYHNQFNLKTCSLRIFSVYGPGLRKQLLWDVYNKTISTQFNSISLYGTGLESRDYIYIDDLIRAIDVVVVKGKFKGTIYNVANGQEIEIQKITNLLVKGLDKDVEIEFSGDVKEGDPLNWVANIDKLSEIGYQSQVSLEEGVNRYIGWLKKE